MSRLWLLVVSSFVVYSCYSTSFASAGPLENPQEARYDVRNFYDIPTKFSEGGCTTDQFRKLVPDVDAACKGALLGHAILKSFLWGMSVGPIFDMPAAADWELAARIFKYLWDTEIDENGVWEGADEVRDLVVQVSMAFDEMRALCRSTRPSWKAFCSLRYLKKHKPSDMVTIDQWPGLDRPRPAREVFGVDGPVYHAPYVHSQHWIAGDARDQPDLCNERSEIATTLIRPVWDRVPNYLVLCPSYWREAAGKSWYYPDLARDYNKNLKSKSSWVDPGTKTLNGTQDYLPLAGATSGPAVIVHEWVHLLTDRSAEEDEDGKEVYSWDGVGDLGRRNKTEAINNAQHYAFFLQLLVNIKSNRREVIRLLDHSNWS